MERVPAYIVELTSYYSLTVSIENMTQENLSMKEENSSPTEEMLRIVARFSSINSSAKGAIVVRLFFLRFSYYH